MLWTSGYLLKGVRFLWSGFMIGENPPGATSPGAVPTPARLGDSMTGYA